MISTVEDIQQLPTVPQEIEVIIRLGGLKAYREWLRNNEHRRIESDGSCTWLNEPQGTYRCTFDHREAPHVCSYCFNTGVVRLKLHHVMAGTGIEQIDRELRSRAFQRMLGIKPGQPDEALRWGILAQLVRSPKTT